MKTKALLAAALTITVGGLTGACRAPGLIPQPELIRAANEHADAALAAQLLKHP